MEVGESGQKGESVFYDIVRKVDNDTGWAVCLLKGTREKKERGERVFVEFVTHVIIPL